MAISKYLKSIRSEYDEIIKSYRGWLLPPGECERLKQKWFDDHSLKVIEMLERHEDRAMEMDEY